MTRVVQDSEDEDDFDVTDPTNSPTSTTPGNSRVQKEELPTSRTKSTSETGKCERALGSSMH